MVVIDGINYPDGTYKDEYGNVILPDGTKCVDVKVALGESEQQEIENRMAENTLKKTAGGSPNRAFATLDELKQALPEGAVIPAEDYSSPYRGTKLVRENQHVYFYNTNSQWEDWGVYQGTMVSPDDPIIVDVRGDIQAVQDNLDLHINDANTKFSEIDTHQDLQDKRLDNHNDRLNDLEDIVHETIVTEVEDDFTGNRIDVPTSVEIEGRNFGVIDNQLFKVSRIKGQTKLSENLHNTHITYPLLFLNYDEATQTYIIPAGSAVGTSGGGSLPFIIPSGTKATMSIFIEKGSYTGGNIYVEMYSRTYPSFKLEIPKINQPNSIVTQTFNLIDEGTGINIFASSGTNVTEEIRFKVMFNLGEYKPFIKSGLLSSSVKNINSIGKNIYEGNNIEGESVIYVDLEHPFKFKANTDYTVSAIVKSTDTDSTKCVVILYSEIGAVGFFYLPRSVDNERTSKTYRFENSSEFVINRIGFFASDQLSTSSGDTFSFKDIQIEVSATATNYTHFVEDSTKDFNIVLRGVNDSFDEIILSKMLNNELFEINKNKRMNIVNLGDSSKITWQYGTPYNFVSTSLQGVAKGNINIQELSNIISEKLPIVSFSRIYNHSDEIKQGIAMNPDGILCANYSGKTLEQFINEMKGINLVYEMKTPIQEQIYNNLSLNDISILGQKGGKFIINSLNEDSIAPKLTSFKFDCKFWEKPKGGNL